MSSGPDDGYFADGLTEEILNSLAGLPELLVTARTSAFSFKGKDLPIQEIAATLNVEHIVEGSVRRSGDRLRVTAQLIRADDGFHLWSETYDRDTANEEAAFIDSRPFGYIALLQRIYFCNCGAPFDLEATPTLAKMLKESGLPWPPESVVDWPLKNW
jgi:hypothetical protein